MSTKNDCTTWDFTWHEGVKEDIDDYCEKWCSDWAYQLEECPTTKRPHYQGRLRLNKPTRNMKGVLNKEIHWSATSKTVAVTKNFNYVIDPLKGCIILDGPWTSKSLYIPRQIREVKALLPWQQTILDLSKEWDKRHIHVIYNPTGGVGKSILTTYMCVYGHGRRIPFANDYKDVLRMVCDMPTSRAYMIDMPKAINKDRLNQLYSALETIKDGYSYDDRYHFKEKWMDCPNLFVFTNTLPENDMMSRDRWLTWEVIDTKLEQYVSNAEFILNTPQKEY